MAGARSDELRVTMLGLALLGLLLLSHTAAPVEAAVQETSFSMNGPGGRTLNSFSMNHADAEKGKGKARVDGAGDF